MTDPGNIRNTTPPDPKPFVIAFIGFVVVAVLAYVFLRDDSPGRLVEPDRIDVVGDDTIRVRYAGPFPEGDAEVLQIGYALGDDVVFVELVIVDRPCAGECPEGPRVLDARLVLPEPVGDREVRTGTGRVLADCTGSERDRVCR